ncbi:hypothetical protein [Actinoplanes sp. M2I2]|uniref:hypothetical protein n=1 Tax=Actinoplanes sp. M2I2 TaxID=1734444 RepID=UPI00201FF6B3|nr:hypothetical protein [Actinoplanes sp. M2I2]
MSALPIGSLLAIGLWADREPGPAGLLVAAEALRSLGAELNGVVWSAEAGVRFKLAVDVAGHFWTDLGASEVHEMLRSGRAYRVGLDLPGLGPVMLGFEGTPEEEPADRHPIRVAMESGPFGIPRELWEDEERAEAAVMRQRVLEVLQALCRALDPAYAIVGEEIDVPNPDGLVTDPHLGWTIGADGYLARRMIERPEVAGHLAVVSPLAQVVEWDTGSFFSGWFLAETPDDETYESAWGAAFLAVGEALRKG